MWLFTTQGFISVVAHTGKPDTLLVRARDESSLLSLQGATGATLTHTPFADYPYRIEVLREAYAAWVLEEISRLTYSNYKSHMCSARPELGDALHEVWAAMHAIETPRVTQEDREKAARRYPNQTWTDEDIEMLKGMGHI
jgi:hypothetical protein